MKIAAALASSLVALAVLAAGTGIATAEDVKATGTWDLVSQTPNGPMNSVMTAHHSSFRIDQLTTIRNLRASVFSLKIAIDESCVVAIRHKTNFL